MSELLPCVRIDPATAATASVIWLHGLGADGHDFEPIVPMLRTTGVRFVFPHAPTLAVTINGGHVMPAWYDIRSLDFDAVSREDPDQIRTSAGRIEALVADERKRGTPSDRIVLCGFSQGAAMAVHVGVRHVEPLAGIIALSGYLLEPGELAAERHAANLGVAVFGGHGTRDEMVPVAAGRACHAALRSTAAQGADHTWHEYPMGHEVCPPELEHVGAWLRARLG